MARGFENNPQNINRTGANKSQRTRDWEVLGKYLIQEGAERFMWLLKDSPDGDFINNYLAVLNYFKPKFSNATVEVHDLPVIEIIDVGAKLLKEGETDVLKS